MRRAGLVLAALAAFCAAAHGEPRRIVSLDYCADQYVLALADRDQIAAVSLGARRDDSYFRDRAAGLRQIRGGLEEVLALQPDLVVRNWGGGFDAARTYARLGVPVLQVGDTANFEAARADLLAAADALGRPARGEALAADLDMRLARLRAGWRADRTRVLYLTAGGAIAGAGVMMDAVIHAAGGANARTAPGWQVLPLERLVAEPPAIVAQGFFETGQIRASPFNFARHPALERALGAATRVPLPAAAISCEAWYAVEAAERLAAAINAT